MALEVLFNKDDNPAFDDAVDGAGDNVVSLSSELVAAGVTNELY